MTPLLLRAEELRRILRLPTFRVSVDDEGRVTFATSREHEHATRSASMEDAVIKWIAIAEPSALLRVELDANDTTPEPLGLANSEDS